MSSTTETTHCYVGRKPCGCIVAVTADTGDRQTAKSVAAFIRDGLTIERMTNDAFRKSKDPFGCIHEQREPKQVQGTMFDVRQMPEVR